MYAGWAVHPARPLLGGVRSIYSDFSLRGYGLSPSHFHFKPDWTWRTKAPEKRERHGASWGEMQTPPRVAPKRRFTWHPVRRKQATTRSHSLQEKKRFQSKKSRIFHRVGHRAEPRPREYQCGSRFPGFGADLYWWLSYESSRISTREGMVLIVGIMSDTHGHHLAAREARKQFDRLGVGHVIHCGDVGGVDVFSELLGVPLTFVWGNTDTPTDGTLSFLRSTGFSAPVGVPTRIELGGKKFAVFHGHEPQFRTCTKLDVDFVLYGHTHEADIEVLDGKCFINPGALFRANPKTVATLDTESSKIQFHEIEVKEISPAR